MPFEVGGLGAPEGFGIGEGGGLDCVLEVGRHGAGRYVRFVRYRHTSGGAYNVNMKVARSDVRHFPETMVVEIPCLLPVDEMYVVSNVDRISQQHTNVQALCGCPE